jgi:hypothetical protein
MSRNIIFVQLNGVSESQLAESGCSWGRLQFGNPEEEERPPLESDTEQRLVKTEKTLCVLQLQWSTECVTQWDCRSYLQARSVNVQ